MPNGDFERHVQAERRVLGDLLRSAREEAGLTQQDAAERIGLTQSAISRFEKGERGLEIAELRLIARTYGKTLGEFLAKGLLSLL